MTTPAVSVILPTYNRAPVLGRAMRSVLAQTFSDLELIVVDDGSTDATEKVVRTFEDPRVRYLPQAHHGSAAIARNNGIRASHAPLVAFQDSDDEWLIDKLALQTAALHASGEDTGLICGGFIALTQGRGTRYWGADERMQAGDWGPDNIYNFCFITPTWLARRKALEAIGLFDETMQNLEDWELTFRLFRQARILALDRPLVVKHSGADSLNARPASRIASLEKIIRRHGELWREHPRVLARLYEELGRWRCRHGDAETGRADLWQSLRLHPGSAKRWGLWMSALLGGNAYNRLHAMRRKTLR